jgi:hypothetical protein
MREARVGEVEGDTLVLLFKHDWHAPMLSNSPDALTDALTELVGGTWKIRCVPPTPVAPSPPIEDDDWPKPAPLPTRTARAAHRPPRTKRSVAMDRTGPKPLPRLPVRPSRCAVYLHYDADGILLYVGMSVAPSLRTGQHAEGSSWVDFAVRGEIAWFDSEDEAAAREVELIRSLQPLFNVAHAVPNSDRRLVEYLVDKKCYGLLAPKVRKG